MITSLYDASGAAVRDTDTHFLTLVRKHPFMCIDLVLTDAISFRNIVKVCPPN